MASQKSMFKNMLAKGTLSIFSFLIPLLIIPYVYRVLDPETVGYVEYGATLFLYFSFLGLLGMYNYGIREISRYREDKIKVKEIYKNLFVIGIISNLIAFIIMLFFIHNFVHEVKLKPIMYIYSVQLIAQIFYIEWVNEAYEDYKFITIKTVIIRIFGIAAIFLLVRSSEDYLIYVFILFLILFLNNVVSFIHAQKKYIRLSVKEIFVGLNLKKYIIPLLFILVLNNTNLLYNAVDRTMLGIYNGAESVAYYSISQKIGDITKTLLLTIVFVAMPRLSFYLQEDREKYADGVRRLMRLTVMIVLPISIGLCLFAEEIVLIFTGDQYVASISSLKVFSLRIIILGLESMLYHQIIFLHRKEKVLLCFNFISGSVNIILNIILVKWYGLTPFNAICTTVVAEIIFEAMCFIYIKKKLYLSTGFFDRKNLVYLFLSLSFIPIIYFIKMQFNNPYMYLPLSIIICALVYVGGLTLSKDDIFIEAKNRILKR